MVPRALLLKRQLLQKPTDTTETADEGKGSPLKSRGPEAGTSDTAHKGVLAGGAGGIDSIGKKGGKKGKKPLAALADPCKGGDDGTTTLQEKAGTPNRSIKAKDGGGDGKPNPFGNNVSADLSIGAIASVGEGSQGSASGSKRPVGISGLFGEWLR